MILTFWITLVGLLSGFINGIISIFEGKKLQLSIKWTDILKVVNVLILFLVIVFLIFNRISEANEITKIKTEISSFVKDPEKNGMGATLSEITLHLRARGYDDSKYSIAITELLKEGILKEEQPKQMYYLDNLTRSTYSYVSLIYH